VVYHNHYAGGNYTTPGTASLLTGTLPWKHRAFQPGGNVDEAYVEKNIFSAFEIITASRTRITYGQIFCSGNSGTIWKTIFQKGSIF
jgi:hypothetical protein